MLYPPSVNKLYLPDSIELILKLNILLSILPELYSSSTNKAALVFWLDGARPMIPSELSPSKPEVYTTDSILKSDTHVRLEVSRQSASLDMKPWTSPVPYLILVKVVSTR